MRVLNISRTDNISKALLKLKKSGARCLIVSEKKKFYGTLSDGDIRNKIKNLNQTDSVSKFYNRKAKYLLEDKINKKILDDFFFKKFLDLVPICNKEKKIIKVILRSDYIQNPEKFLNISKNEIVPILIMSGGLGSRLRPITNIIPKPLLPLGKWTVLEEIINRFKLYGFEKIYLSVNYYSDLIVTYINQKKIKNLKFIKEKKQLGTLGSISLLNKKNIKNLMVTNCDVLLDLNLKKFLKFHLEKDNDLSMVVVNKNIKIPYGVCRIEKDNLKNIEEKPNINFKINAGMYLMKDTVFKFFKNSKKVDFDKFYQLIRKKNYKIGVYLVSNSRWKDTGTFNSLEATLKRTEF
jgi:dTDP-glucose pyrophosphorylase